MPQDDHTPTVSVTFPADGAGWAAVVSLAGEHDILTKEEVSHALRAPAGNVLVDLSGCTFVDSTVIGELVRAARSRADDDRQLALVVPSSNESVWRTLEIARVGTLVTILESSPLPGRDGDEPDLR
jgi:anti-anti-sigma factor